MMKQFIGSNGSNFTTVSIKNEFINSEIMPTTIDETTKSRLLAEEQKLSTADLSKCIEDVKKFYNISKDVTLIYKKTDFPVVHNQLLKDANNKTDPGVNL